ncbi:MAG: sugar kinase [Litorimonas sp.]
MIPRIITFGELMMRLSTPQLERFSQARTFDVSFGGAEANVAVSLAMFGCESVFVSALPDNPLGDRAMQELGRYGVDTSEIIRSDDRLGVYYMEFGANQRSGQVVYDRAGSAFSKLSSTSVDWPPILSGDWFHISGISPAVSASAADLSLAAMKAAKAAGLTVSLDLNYRSLLWNYGRKPEDVLISMVEAADILIAGRGDCQQALDIHGKGDPDGNSYFESLTETVMARFPNLRKVAVTIRDSRSAEHHNWAACLRSPGGIRFSRKYEIRDIVDRVGSGDAFSAGLIYALIDGMSDEDALEFAAAANCLKHSVVGDFNLVSRHEVMEIAKGGGQGRVKR